MTTNGSDDPPNGKTGPRLISRREITARYGIHSSKIRRREADGKLTPILLAGVYHYEVLEVLRAFASDDHVPSKDGGHSYENDLAAEVFKLFAVGWTSGRIVIELQQHPQKIADLLKYYQAQGQDQILPSAIVQEIEELGIGGEGYRLRPSDLPKMLRAMKAKIQQLQTRLYQLQHGSDVGK